MPPVVKSRSMALETGFTAIDRKQPQRGGCLGETCWGYPVTWR